MTTEWIYSVVMLIPAQLREQANRLAEGLGHGPDNFYTALSADGSEPATHFGCFTAAQESFIQLLTAAGGGTLPEIEGMTPQEVGAVLMSLTTDVATGVVASEHVRSVLEANGLVPVVVTEPQPE